VKSSSAPRRSDSKTRPPNENARFDFNGLTATAQLLPSRSTLRPDSRPRPRQKIIKIFGGTYSSPLRHHRHDLPGSASGYVTRLPRHDAVLGMALKRTGAFLPFFGSVHRMARSRLTGTSDPLQRPLRRLQKKHRPATVNLSPLLMMCHNSAGRRHGQNDRPTIHLLAHRRHQPGRPGRRPSSLRLLAIGSPGTA